MDTNTVYTSMRKEAGVFGTIWDALKNASPQYQLWRATKYYLPDTLKTTRYNLLHGYDILNGTASPKLTRPVQNAWDTLQQLWQGATKYLAPGDQSNAAPTEQTQPEVKTASQVAPSARLLLDALFKQAAGGSPEQPMGTPFKMPPPITAPGSVPLDQQAAPMQQPKPPADPQVTAEKTKQQVLGAYKSTLSTLEALSNPQGAQPGAPAAGQQIPPAPQPQPAPTDRINPAPLPKAASDYGAVYMSMKKRATFLFGPEA